jgi:hypothetical protein
MALLIERTWPSLCAMHDREDMDGLMKDTIRDDVAGRWNHHLTGSLDSSRSSAQWKAVERSNYSQDSIHNAVRASGTSLE